MHRCHSPVPVAPSGRLFPHSMHRVPLTSGTPTCLPPTSPARQPGSSDNKRHKRANTPMTRVDVGLIPLRPFEASRAPAQAEATPHRASTAARGNSIVLDADELSASAKTSQIPQCTGSGRGHRVLWFRCRWKSPGQSQIHPRCPARSRCRPASATFRRSGLR